MKTESVTIILPLPPPCLSPNRPPASRGGRMKKAAAAKKYREQARIEALSQSVESSPWEKVTVKAVFFHKQKRRRDDVNHLAMLKPAYDGIVDAELIVDDDSEHLVTLPPEFCTDRALSRIELTVSRVEMCSACGRREAEAYGLCFKCEDQSAGRG